jgi:putative FmdB family regulatory protein
MPIYEYRCLECGNESEQIVFGNDSGIRCPSCGGSSLEKLMSATSSLTGSTPHRIPGPKDTGCCGSRPGEASGCAGPGSCCGRA